MSGFSAAQILGRGAGVDIRRQGGSLSAGDRAACRVSLPAHEPRWGGFCEFGTPLIDSALIGPFAQSRVLAKCDSATPVGPAPAGSHRSKSALLIIATPRFSSEERTAVLEAGSTGRVASQIT